MSSTDTCYFYCIMSYICSSEILSYHRWQWLYNAEYAHISTLVLLFLGLSNFFNSLCLVYILGEIRNTHFNTAILRIKQVEETCTIKSWYRRLFILFVLV